MARYRKVDTRTQNDERWRALSTHGQLLWFVLMTHPQMTMLGAMRGTVEGLVAERGREAEDFRKGFEEILAKGMAKYDAKACMIWLPRFIRYNQPESPNVVKSWDGSYDDLPECAMKSELLQELARFIEGMGEGFQKAFREGIGEGYVESGAGTGAGTGKDGGTPPARSEGRAAAPKHPVPASKPAAAMPELVWTQDGPPGGVESAEQLARGLLDVLGLPVKAELLGLAATAIDAVGERGRRTLQDAAKLVLVRIRIAQKRGEFKTPKFWFEDGKHMIATEPRNQSLRAPAQAWPAVPPGADLEAGHAAWEALRRDLRRGLSVQSFDTWIRPLRANGLVEDVLHVAMPNAFFGGVPEKFKGELEEAMPEGVRALAWDCVEIVED